MALSFHSSQPKKRSEIISIDLGTRTTKAVYFQRKGQAFDLVQFAIQDSPITEKGLVVDVLSEHFKKIVESLGCKTKQVALVASVDDSLLRHAELPLMPVADMRLMLKYSSKNHLQQDLPDHIFDCYVLPARTNVAHSAEPLKSQKCRVLVGASKKDFLDKLQEAAKAAGLVAEYIIPNLAGTPNAFEMAHGEIFSKEVVALVDIGFKHSTINILHHGELVLSRVVGIGGDKLTSGLAEVMNLSYPEAEVLKLQMSEEVQPIMMSLLIPLGRELRASLDFFEKQEDKTVSHVFVSGGSARSPFVVESLQTELMIPCKSWNPVSFANLALPAQQMGEIEQAAPQLAVATGGALAAL